MAKKKQRKAKSPKKAKSKAAGLSLRIGQEIWPCERDVLFRPERYKYVRKMIEPDGCVFCKAAETVPSVDTLCVHQTKHSMVVLNKFPYNTGHLLILPRRHCGDMLELSDSEFFDLQDLIRQTVRAVQTVYEPGGMNMGLNSGRVAGAGLPDHLHYHLVPRWAGDLNFFPLIAETKVVIESLAETYQRVSRYFQNT